MPKAGKIFCNDFSLISSLKYKQNISNCAVAVHGKFLETNECVVLAHKQAFVSKNCLNQATHSQMSKTEATVFVAAGSLLTGFANCMGRGCHESLSNRTGGNFLIALS